MLGEFAPPTRLPDGIEQVTNWTTPMGERLRRYQSPHAHTWLSKDRIDQATNVSWNVNDENYRMLPEVQEVFRGGMATKEDLKKLDRINLRVARKAMREVTDAITYDVQNFQPKALKWSATSLSRAQLYDSLLRRLAAQHGYHPTLGTRFNRVVRKVVRAEKQRRDRPRSALYDYASGPLANYYYRHGLTDVYKRHGLTRQVLSDLLASAAPAGAAAALAAGMDDDE
jgi:hypothetical protein